ncbi:MAG: hypothetical protein NTY01_03550 [Verrucomicrobia bacterium]|nr:hypothetical protein [Verrucomicrobiota bacterium]
MNSTRTTAAPTGRKRVAQGKEQSGCGVSPLIQQNNQSRDGSATFATSLSIEPDDFDAVPFNQHGGLGKAYQLFGEQLPKLLDELNEVLAA